MKVKLDGRTYDTSKYEYARSKTKEEIKAEHIGEFTQGEEDSEEEDDE
ncbi:MAG TPA: hypothetical protein PLX91_11080 [Thermotogota bacterium]|nr:hypothetical protein [Thermotogota bacterium]